MLKKYFSSFNSILLTGIIALSPASVKSRTSESDNKKDAKTSKVAINLGNDIYWKWQLLNDKTQEQLTQTYETSLTQESNKTVQKKPQKTSYDEPIWLGNIGGFELEDNKTT
jgi:hypothetical protein